MAGDSCVFESTLPRKKKFPELKRKDIKKPVCSNFNAAVDFLMTRIIDRNIFRKCPIVEPVF